MKDLFHMFLFFVFPSGIERKWVSDWHWVSCILSKTSLKNRIICISNIHSHFSFFTFSYKVSFFSDVTYEMKKVFWNQYQISPYKLSSLGWKSFGFNFSILSKHVSLLVVVSHNCHVPIFLNTWKLFFPWFLLVKNEHFLFQFMKSSQNIFEVGHP